MRGLKHMMAGMINQGTLGPCKVSPQHEDYALTIVRDIFDDRISKLFPAYLAMGSSLSGTDGKDSIQEKYALRGPFFKIRTAAHPDAQVRLYFLEDVLQ